MRALYAISFTSLQITAVGVALGATIVMCDWWMELVNLKEEWRCALKIFGVQCVMMPGTTEMPKWFVHNLDTLHKVSVFVCSDKAKYMYILCGYDGICVMVTSIVQ